MESKKDIRNSTLLKTISYLMIPIAIGMLALNLVYLYTIEYQKDYVNKRNYYETNNFSNNYENQVQSILRDIENINSTNWSLDYEEPYQNEQGERIYFSQYRSSYDFFQYLVVNRQTKEMYTNIVCTDRTDSLEEIKEVLAYNDIYWNYENKNISSNIENLKLENLPYNSSTYQWLQKIENFDIYTAINLDNMERLSSNQFATGRLLYDLYNIIYKIPYAVITPISIILLFISMVYLAYSLGHKKYHQGIYLDWLDKIPLEILLIIAICAFAFGLQITFATSYYTIQKAIIGISCGLLESYLVISITLTSIVKRIKAKKLAENTIFYQILFGMKNMMKDIYGGFHLNSKIILQYIGVSILTLILLFFTAQIYNFNTFWFLILLAFWIYLLVRLCKITKQCVQLQQAIQAIYEGKADVVLNTEQFKGEFKQIAIYLNDIAGGLSKAVEKSLKSERLKTELITNVSHDIKTPLTSIINYIGLLQKEEINNPKVAEYLRILDYKSQRLKKLTEDLIEASKVSSGNISLHLEKIAVKELIQQAIGEFKDKFDERGLEILVTMPQEEIYVQVDSRYMYRIIENLFTNLYKYAQENSRIYLDIIVQNKQVSIQIKNISKEKLNISTDELMQRFVRGDKSRTTEGSGLGLSISESLAKLLGGEFKIYIDGDLFKTELIFKII